jgi:hypothetical protein
MYHRIFQLIIVNGYHHLILTAIWLVGVERRTVSSHSHLSFFLRHTKNFEKHVSKFFFSVFLVKFTLKDLKGGIWNGRNERAIQKLVYVKVLSHLNMY